MPYTFRKAEPDDYDAIYTIWMQPHVIKWMSFTKQDNESFRAHYERLFQSSEIYVLVNEAGKVVAVRRLVFGKGPHHHHTVAYCSMGVDSAWQGKGCASQLYEDFLKLAKERGVKRIELTQSGGNFNAFHLAETKYNFTQEAEFPDWLKREADGGHFYLIERYMYQIIDDKLAKDALKLPRLTFTEQIPSLQPQDSPFLSVQRHNNQFTAFLKDAPLLTLDFDPDNSVIQHIGFLTIQLLNPCEEANAVAALRQILLALLLEGRVKKLELFTESPAVAKLCQAAGFFVRGEKIASYFDEQQGYQNELGLEYSFMAIEDAKSLIQARITDPVKQKDIAKLLADCQSLIAELANKEGYDALGCCYLENLIYQAVRDSLEANKLISLSSRPWLPLLEKIPAELKNLADHLLIKLQQPVISFFQPAPVNFQSSISMVASLK